MDTACIQGGYSLGGYLVRPAGDELAGQVPRVVSAAEAVARRPGRTAARFGNE